MSVRWICFLFTVLLTEVLHPADQWAEQLQLIEEELVEEEFAAQQAAIVEEEDDDDDDDEAEAVFAPLPVLQRQQAGLWVEPGGIEAAAVEEEVEEAAELAEEEQEEQPAPAVAEAEVVFGLVPHQAPADAMGENGNNGAAAE